MRSITILLSFILISSCLYSAKSAELKLTIINDQHVNVHISYYFPNVSLYQKEGIFNNEVILIDISQPAYLQIEVENKLIPVFLKPNDKVSISLDKSFELLKYSSPDNDLKSFYSFRENFAQFEEVKTLKINSEEYMAIATSYAERAKAQLHQLSKNTEKWILSNEYIDFEKNNITYQEAILEMDYSLQNISKYYKVDKDGSKVGYSTQYKKLFKVLMPKYPLKSNFKYSYSSPEYLNYVNRLFKFLARMDYFPSFTLPELSIAKIAADFNSVLGNSSYGFSRFNVELLIQNWDSVKHYVDSPEYIDYIQSRIKKNKEVELFEENNIRTRKLEVIEENSLEWFNSFLKDNSGKVVYVDFWATWCGPCIASFPASREVYDEVISDEIVFLYICPDSPSKQEQWRKIVQEYNLGGNHVFIPSKLLKSDLTRHFKINEWPTYMIFNKNGKLVERKPPPPQIKLELLNLLNKYSAE